MASTSETGHAKNISNFQDMIDACTGYGLDYQPSRDNLKLIALNTQKAACAAAQTAVKDPLADYSQAVGIREKRYESLDPLVTRINSQFQLTSAPANVKKNENTMAKKVRGTNRKRKKPLPPGEAPEDEAHSTSQRSFVMIADNFETLISILEAEPTYDPAEDDLKVTSLKAVHAHMLSLNTAANTAFDALNTVRTARNLLLYAEGTGLVDIALDVKKYVASVFGTRSTKYKEISGLKFTRMKKKPVE